MRQWYQEFLRQELRNIFDESDAETVLTWLISNEGRKPVVVVGAGFSRNALNRRTNKPVTCNEIPLWGDLLDQFRQDLSLGSSTTYDALTLAELRYDEMMPASFYSTLLEMVNNDDLKPGEAHEALFNYPVEAVVTTNMLDTLLDQNKRDWLRVVENPDLAIRKCGASKVELIYFHGHRNIRKSWVLTRSQYEDVTTSRALVVTRVRQLLSQHPVLLVGYGLGDPDFHHIYRQISLDMSYNHPLGLALFPRCGGPKPSEIRHWGKLGIRIAKFRDDLSTNEAFKKFFGISPVFEGHLREPTGGSSGSPPAPVRSDELLKSRLLDEADFETRLRVAEDFSSYSERENKVRTNQYSEYYLWLAAIEAEFTPEEWKGINTIYEDDAQYTNGDTSAVSTQSRNPASTFRGFKELPARRYSALDQLPRQIDAFLSRHGNLKTQLARWMKFAWHRQLVHDEPSLFLDLLSWLSRAIVTDSKGDASDRDEATATIRECLIYAQKYDFPHSRIIDDASAVGLDTSTIGPAGDLPSDFLRAMQEGFSKTLDGLLEEAQTAYARATELARDTGNSLGQWVAVRGEYASWSATVDIRDRFDREWRSANDDYWQRIENLEQHLEVSSWLKKAQSRRAGLNEFLV